MNGYVASDTAGAVVSDQFQLVVENTNRAPVLDMPLHDQTVLQGGSFSFVVPDGTFIDADIDDSLTFGASLPNGDPLPGWLDFDPVSGTFAGQLPVDFVRSMEIQVSAIDSHGGSASDVFLMAVATPREPVPETTLAYRLADQYAMRNRDFSFELPVSTFNSAGDVFYSATLGNGDALPAWLKFDPMSRILSGTVPGDADSHLSVTLVAHDPSGGVADASFDLHIAGGRVYSGTAESETVRGSGRGDTVIGGGGRDVLYGFPGDDGLVGGMQADRLYAGNGDDIVDGNSGDDMLFGYGGDDALFGGDGQDRIFGNGGQDVLVGGHGDDRLYGGTGDDLYRFERGFGRDTIVDESGGSDTVRFGHRFGRDQLWFEHVDDDLLVNVLDSDEQLTIDNWYAENADTIERFELASGEVLLHSQVELLVEAMAAFDVPESTDADYNRQVKERIEPLLSSTWQSVGAGSV